MKNVGRRKKKKKKEEEMGHIYNCPKGRPVLLRRRWVGIGGRIIR